MSQVPHPSDPFGEPQLPMEYYSGIRPNNAPTLIRLAVIFNYISVGLDACLALLALGAGLLFTLAPDSFPRDPGDPPAWVLGVIYLAAGCLIVPVGIVKAIATRKLQLARPGAWGWSLAAGIIGCAQLLCGSCCCLQPAAGVYTVIILCFSGVQAHLAATQNAGMRAG